MDLHFKEACRKLELRDITLPISVKGTKSIHDVEVKTGVVEMVLFIFNDL
jgi:hypothetical protein